MYKNKGDRLQKTKFLSENWNQRWALLKLRSLQRIFRDDNNNNIHDDDHNDNDDDDDDVNHDDAKLPLLLSFYKKFNGFENYDENALKE